MSTAIPVPFPDSMEIVYRLDETQIRQLHRLYQQEWWCKGRTLDQSRISVERSSLSIGLIDQQGGLKGYARVLTDYVFKALIFDVIVASESRGQGLGDQLMQLIRDHPDLQRVKHFELYCRPEMFPFYQRHGFSSDVGETRLLRLQAR